MFLVIKNIIKKYFLFQCSVVVFFCFKFYLYRKFVGDRGFCIIVFMMGLFELVFKSGFIKMMYFYLYLKVFKLFDKELICFQVKLVYFIG